VQQRAGAYWQQTCGKGGGELVLTTVRAQWRCDESKGAVAQWRCDESKGAVAQWRCDESLTVRKLQPFMPMQKPRSRIAFASSIDPSKECTTPGRGPPPTMRWRLRERLHAEGDKHAQSNTQRVVRVCVCGWAGV
jgi:hypothetical protein